MSIPISQLFLFRVLVSLVKYSFCSFIFIPGLIKLPFWVFLYLIEFMGCATAGGGVAVRLWSPQWLEGQDPRPHCWSVTCSHGCWCGLEPGVMCAASPAATVFSEAVGTAAVVRGPGLQALIPLFPRSISSKCSNPPAFRCTDVWSPLANCCGGQWHLCWVVDVLLVVDWRGETKVVFHSVMFLTSLWMYHIFLSIHPLMDIWIISSFGLLWVMWLWTFVYKFFVWTQLSFIFG